MNRTRGYPGGKFIFDLWSEEEPPLWGADSHAVWIEGEPLMICGDQGVGKSALGQQLALARTGVHKSGELLGLPVRRAERGRKVLYLAMDRPRQIQRSFRRMVNERDHKRLNSRLVVYAGPLSHLNVARHPEALMDWIEEEHPQVSDVIVDSLKDLAVGLTDDNVAAGVNSAIQNVVAGGREVVVLHHQRKAQSTNKQPDALADVYGSNWLTAGMGSVALLKGSPGGSAVEFRHLKQPAEPVGPLHVVHDRETGRSRARDAGADVLTTVVRAGEAGATLEQVARAVYRSDGDSGKQRARRELKKLVTEGALVYRAGASGGKGGGGEAARWLTR